jgi:hypothetical protein
MDNRALPVEKIGLLFGLLTVFTIISLLRGSGDDSPIDVRRCDN